MSPSINVSPDLLGMFKQQSSPVDNAAATDLVTLCSALDLLQTGGQVDLNALAACLSRLSDWLKNDQEVAPGDISGWTSEPFGLKGIGGMITCRNKQWEVIFNQDGSGLPYMGMWHSRVPGEVHRNGSFKIQASDGGTQLVLEGSHPLQVSLPLFGAATFGSMDAFYQGLNSSSPPNAIAAPSAPSTQQQSPPIPPQIPETYHSPDEAPTILSSRRSSPNLSAAQPPQLSENKPSISSQPKVNNSDPWQCTCGNMNTAHFCSKCGLKRPIANNITNRAPVQPAFCKQCGATISPGSRFCRNCGAELIK